MSDIVLVIVVIVFPIVAGLVSAAGIIAYYRTPGFRSNSVWKKRWEKHWEMRSGEEATSVQHLLRDVALVRGDEIRDRPSMPLSRSSAKKLKKYSRFIPIVVKNPTGDALDYTLQLETWEETDRWTFKSGTPKARLNLWNTVELGKVGPDNPRWARYSIRLWSHSNLIGDLCVRPIEKPASEGPFRWKLSYGDKLINEGELDIP